MVCLSERVRPAVQWDEFEQNLFLKIMSFPVRIVLVISLVDRSVLLMQSGGIDAFNTGRFTRDDADMIAEFSGKNGRRDMVAFTEQ